MRLTVIVTDLFYFFTLLAFYRFVQSTDKSKDSRLRYNVKWFGVFLFEGALLTIDNSSFQYNSMIFALIIWTTILMLQKRYLLAALLYCVAVLTKQIAIYYSAAYVGYFLVYFVLDGKQIHWLRLIKLVLIVISSVVLTFLPFIGHINQAIHLITGGENIQVSYGPLPSIQMVYALMRNDFDLHALVPMPPLITLSFIGLASLFLMSLIYREQSSFRVRLPLYLSLSGVVFFVLMPIVH